MSHAKQQALIAGLSEVDRNRLLWWHVAHGGDRPREAMQWITSLRDVIDSLMTTPQPALASLFWLRLEGTLDEFRDGYAPKELRPPTDPKDAREADGFALEQMYAELATSVYSACQHLLDEFTRDELLYIEWRRDTEAHPWVDSYDLRPKRSGTTVELRDARCYALVDGPVPHDELRTAKSVVAGSRSVIDVAVAFAMRAKRHVDAIIAALDEMNAA